MPRRTMSSVARPSMRWPAKRISPWVRTMPQSARSVVVLPAPLAPSSVVIVPSSMEKLMPCSTRVWPYEACKAAASRKAMLGGAPQVGLDEFGMLLNLRGCPFGDLLAEIQRHDAIRNAHHQAHV